LQANGLLGGPVDVEQVWRDEFLPE
jgi:hypothetical protein